MRCSAAAPNEAASLPSAPGLCCDRRERSPRGAVMEAAEFDRFADEYDAMHQANIAITGERPDYFAEYKIRVLRQIVPDAAARRIVDFGSGIGNSIPHFRKYFPESDLVCADVSQRSLDLSQSRFPGLSRSLLIDGARIAAADAACDLAFSACV